MTREEAKQILEEVKVMDDSMYQYNQKYLEALDMAIKALEQEPKTDRIEYGTDGNSYKLTISNGKEFEQQPKTGHWIGDNQAFYIYAKCSECGSVHDTATNYCPECGCLMDRTEFDEYVKTEGA